MATAEQAVSGLTRIDGIAWIAIPIDWECVCCSVVCADYGGQVNAVLPSRPA